MSSPLCLQFSQLYKGKIPGQACFGDLNVGREYICPNTSPKAKIEEQELSPWFQQQSARMSSTCHAALPQLGRSVLCKKQQTGGGATGMVHDPTKYQYSATGELVEYDCGPCRKGGQRGGAGLPLGENVSAERMGAQPLGPLESGRNFSCGYLKFDKSRQYKNVPQDSPGYMFDLGATAVGNRPVMTEHDNTVPKKIKQKKHNEKRSFDCKQPFWGKPCM